MRRRVVTSLFVVSLLGTVVPAFPQTLGGAFERLSPGDQRIARSLFDAQRRDVAPGRRLTLDQIAARKSGEGWGGVFKDMKADGLVTQKNLGQIVDRRQSRAPGAAHTNRALDNAAAGRMAAASPREPGDDAARGMAPSAAPAMTSTHGRGGGGER